MAGIFVFIFGLCLGSFLHSIAYRTANKQSFLKGYSYCPKCKHRLGAVDLVPVLSFVFFKGRCRYCHQKISWQYPLVEILTGVILLLIFLKFNSNFLYIALISSIFIIVFVYDLNYYLIPDKLVYLGIIIVLLNEFSLSRLLIALFAGGFFFLIWFFSHGRWMGFGDVSLVFLIAMFLGFPLILVSLFSAFLIGAIIGLSLIVIGRKGLRSKVPFGPFLVIGAFIALFWGNALINWYIGLI